MALSKSSSVASPKFGLLATLAVDGNVLAEPLLLAGFVMPDGSTHDVLIVVTGHDSVYAFDAQTDAELFALEVRFWDRIHDGADNIAYRLA